MYVLFFYLVFSFFLVMSEVMSFFGWFKVLLVVRVWREIRNFKIIILGDEIMGGRENNDICLVFWRGLREFVGYECIVYGWLGI